ncbi:MAG TPA: serine/threonine-protein kinase [Thermoanaerobaculia bacterium]|nr:serine/threonine-protein kinase [Thermoanaerobaculia bacterium]
MTLFQRTYASRLIDGKYQILDRLGVGGMGEIFKVRHIHLNELRVIKIMRPNVAADDQGMQRFLQEARTSTMIKHKNLAMLYDFAQLEDGSYYMVWEFIDGTNIQKWIAQNGPVPARLGVEISMQALAGLEHLHSMGLIHRDISPENIMLSQDRQGKLAVKVIDFGIAKQLGESEGGQGLTQTGMFLGKLKYASPEQAGFLKEGEHLDPRSDLYSFGIVMYEMLAGKAPFQATNPHGYILKHVTEKPAPIIATNPDVKIPAQLESIIMRSLEKSRDARYATAAEFEHALEAIRNTIPPDTKFGLGERMITLSGAQTLADLPKVTAASFTSPSPTTGTRSAADEATIMERGLTQPTMVGKTVGPTGTRAAADEATVMENFGAAAPTAVEQKWGPQTAAEPTVLERQMSPGAIGPKKSNMGMFAAIAAVVVIVIAAGAYFMFKKQAPAAVATNVPSATQVTTTASAPIAAGKGQLLLSAAPWGDIEKIVGSDQKIVPLSDDETSLPRRFDLPPGTYQVTVAGPKGPKTVTVNIEAGKKTSENVAVGDVDIDNLTKEIGQ